MEVQITIGASVTDNNRQTTTYFVANLQFEFSLLGSRLRNEFNIGNPTDS